MNLNLICPINKLSYGVVGRNIFSNFLSKGINVSLFPLGQIETESKDELNQIASHVSDPQIFNNPKLFDPKAPCLRIYHQNMMHYRVGSGPYIGFPIFELNKFNEIEKHHLSQLDHILVCSEWAKDIILDEISKTEDEISIVPLGVNTDIFSPSINTNDKTIFINIGKWEIRKGHDVLIKAFEEAFDESDNFELWLSTFNPFPNPNNEKLRNLYTNSKLKSNIRLIPRLNTQKDLANLISKTDCGVFPSRAEGWNLPLLEMMACGKHVIATDYSGHTEFCHIENTKLIRIDESETANDEVWFHGQGEWAKFGQEQIEQLVNRIKDIHTLKQTGRLDINQSGIDTAKSFSWEKSASRIIESFKKYV